MTYIRDQFTDKEASADIIKLILKAIFDIYFTAVVKKTEELPPPVENAENAEKPPE